MKYLNKTILRRFGIISLIAVLFVLKAKAQVFAPFFVGNNPPLVNSRPAIISKIEIDGTDITSNLDGFQTQTGDVWFDWEPSNK
jgi:hypothetical protein